MTLVQYLQQLLAIESPTYEEKAVNDFIEQDLMALNPDFFHRCENGIICEFNADASKPRLAFVGHSDVVPDFFQPYIEHNRLHGAGASDMKGGLAAFLYFVKEHKAALLQRYNISLIVYTKEERTPIEENGLFSLFKHEGDRLKNIDCAIVAEPTDNAIQLGCLGSLHVTLSIQGKEAHSARPWHGENALYKGLPLIQAFSQLEPKTDVIDGLDFIEVMSITECDVPKGRTTVPGELTCNINFRFSPRRSEQDALAHVKAFCEAHAVSDMTLSLLDSAPSGSILHNAFSDTVIHCFSQKIEAKQAWTDVAQLTQHGIPAFNFGPGLQSQAHLSNEYICIDSLSHYYALLQKLLA